jgi:flagellar basal body rod protein FlgF
MLLLKQKLHYPVLISSLLIYLICLPGNKLQFTGLAHSAENQHQFQTENNDKLQELLKEKYNILKTIVEEMNRSVKNGFSPKNLRKVTIDMLYAEADLCTTQSERIKIHQKVVDILRKREKLIERGVTNGQMPPIEFDRAKLVRLDAQIKLQKEKLKQKAAHNIPDNSTLKIITEARDVIIENITNAHSIAYKKNIAQFIDNETLVIKRDFSQGKMTRTTRPLDLAISGKGFFSVTDSKDRIFFTRNGAFLVNSDGMLVLTTGQFLEPAISIPLDTQKIHITNDGSVSCTTADGIESVVGAIELSRFQNEQGLEYQGKGLYTQTKRSGNPITGSTDSEGFGHIESGFLEKSNVDLSEQSRILSELGTFEQFLSSALSIGRKESLWIKQSPFLKTQKLKEKPSVIVHIKTKKEIVTILSGPNGPLYNVATKEGKVLGQHLSAREFQENLPDIYRLLKTSYADDLDNIVIWTGCNNLQHN